MNTSSNIGHALDAMTYLLSESLREAIKGQIIEDNPEESLVIWQCSCCGCDCAGQSSTGMCMTCEQLTPEQRGEDK